MSKTSEPSAARPRADPFVRATGRRLAACLVTTGLVLAGCAGPREPGDRPRALAESLAGSLQAGDVSELPMAQTDGQVVDSAAVEADRETALSFTDGISPAEVSLEDLSQEAEDGSRTATLGWRWDLPGTDEDWRYETTATLVPASEDPTGQSTGSGSWSVVWDRSILEPSLAADEALRITALPASRGDITGAGGSTIVTERPVHRIGLDKSEVPDGGEEDAARDLAKALDIDADSYAQTVEANGPDAFVEAITLREGDFRDLDSTEMQQIPGLLVQPDEIPLAPTPGFARDLLGSVGQATEEETADSDGQLETGDEIGRGGLQQAHDERLRGQDGVLVETVSVGADGTANRLTAEPLVKHPARDGEHLALTLDPVLQQRAEQILADVGSPSAIVAIRPSSGDVLASANGPGSEGYSTALLGQYAPGSTFKVATALGLVREGATPDTRIECRPEVSVDGTRFANAPTYPESSLGEITLRESMAQSCNTSFISQHEQLDQAELADAARALGVGQPLDLGVPAFEGSIPDEEPAAQHAAAMIGQGRTLVSPLVMAVMAASVADGELVTPALVDDGSAPDDAHESGGTPEKPLTDEEAAGLQDMMRAVVTEGHLDSLRGLEPDTALGKTGTAEYGTEDPPKTHSWVIASHDDLAVAVFVEDGDYGSVTGAPLMQEMLEAAQQG